MLLILGRMHQKNFFVLGEAGGLVLPLFLSLLAWAAQAAEPSPLCHELWRHVQQTYYQPVDENAFFAACPDNLPRVLNPHSELVSYPSPEAAADEVAGVGVELYLQGDAPQVVSPLPGSPAAQAKLQRGDWIRAIDGVATEGLSLAEVSRRLRGKNSSQVQLTVERGGELLVLPPITRQIIRVRSVHGEELKPGFLWLRVARFESNTQLEVYRLLKARHEAADKPPLQGVIFDFRQNDGGLLDAALALASMYLPEPVPLIHVEEAGGKKNTILGSDREALRGGQRWRLPAAVQALPLLVLINKNTGAAPEMVAGIWQYYGKAQVLGTPSFGKNTLETLLPITQRPHSYLKLTSGEWSYPDHSSVAGQGLRPDLLAGAENDALLTAEANDAMVAQALAVLEERVRYTAESLPADQRAAQKWFAAHQRGEALAAFNRILAKVPDAQAVRYRRAAVLAELGEVALARRERTLLGYLATPAEQRTMAALTCWTGIFTGDDVPARSACREEIGDDPLDASAWLNVGHLALRQGDTKAAWAHYQVALPMMGGYWSYHLADAQEDFRVLAQPQFLPAHFSSKQVQTLQQRFERAYRVQVAALQRAEALSIKLMRGTLDESLAPQARQQLLEKIQGEENKHLPANHPRRLITLKRLGMVHLEQAQCAKALPYFSIALAGFRDLPQSQSNQRFLERAIRACSEPGKTPEAVSAD